MVKSPENNPPIRLSFFYGWVVVAAGMLGIFACLGLGRFALGMLLPAMARDLQLSYWQMGFISTCNFSGYLVAVLLCSWGLKQLGYRRLISIALITVGGSMALMGQANSPLILALLYIITGLGSGMANVPIMALVPSWFAPSLRGRAAGFVVIGSGFAIILSGKLVPYFNELQTDGWRLSWLVLGTIVLFVAGLCYWLIRDNPKGCGLTPLGKYSEPAAVSTDSYNDEKTANQVSSLTLAHCAALYFLFGFTYVIYVTFIVTTLVQERGFSEVAAGQFWAWVGFLSLFSGPVFGTVSDHLGRKKGLALVFAIQSLAYLCVGLPLPDIFLYFSIGFFGIVAWSIPGIMAALIGDYVGSQRTGQVFAFVTFIFGLGQIAGPFLAGILAEMNGSFTISFLLASILAVGAAVLALFLPNPPGRA